MLRFKTILVLTLTMLASAALATAPSQSSIQFTLTHPLHTINGKCDSISVSGLDYTYQAGKFQLKSPFRVEIPYRSLDTGNSNRDSHMLEVLGYPTHKSILAEIQTATQNGTSLSISGYLTIKGTRKPFSTTAKLEMGEAIMIKGQTAVSLTDFGVERPSLLGMATSDSVDITYSFTLPVP